VTPLRDILMALLSAFGLLVAYVLLLFLVTRRRK